MKLLYSFTGRAIALYLPACLCLFVSERSHAHNHDLHPDKQALSFGGHRQSPWKRHNFTSDNSSRRIVHGIVRASLSDTPIEGARIQCPVSGTTVYTGRHGRFTLPVDDAQGVVSVRYMGYEQEHVRYDLDRRPDITVRLIPDLSPADQLIPGDTITDFLWDLPISVSNHAADRTNVTLREYKDTELLVLYFWARWCVPCVKAVEIWENVQPVFGDRVKVFTVFVDFEKELDTFLQGRNWSLPILTGENCTLINRHFFSANQVGGTVMIRDGRLYAVPGDAANDEVSLARVLNGEMGVFKRPARYAYGVDERRER